MAMVLVLITYVYCDDSINCLLVLGKSHVTPLNVIIVPRLELTAAVIAAKISVSIHREMDYDLCRVIFWTDATMVLRYLHNKATRIQMLIANRLKFYMLLCCSCNGSYISCRYIF